MLICVLAVCTDCSLQKRKIVWRRHFIFLSVHTKSVFKKLLKNREKKCFYWSFAKKVGISFRTLRKSRYQFGWFVPRSIHPFTQTEKAFTFLKRKKTFVPFLQYEKFVWTKPSCISTVFTLQVSILNCDNFVQMSVRRVRSVQHFRGVKYLQHTFRGNITLMTHMKVFEHMW